MKILAIDVDYEGEKGFAAGVLFHSWTATEPSQIFYSQTANIAAYTPGQFYKRELPCILNLLASNNLKPDIIIVDGHVFLDGVKRPGLGAYLYEALNRTTKIIGVGKNRFKEMPDTYGVLRGKSETALYVTAAGMSAEDAKAYSPEMHGPHRIPALLKCADAECRKYTKESQDARL